MAKSFKISEGLSPAEKIIFEQLNQILKLLGNRFSTDDFDKYFGLALYHVAITLATKITLKLEELNKTAVKDALKSDRVLDELLHQSLTSYATTPLPSRPSAQPLSPQPEFSIEGTGIYEFITAQVGRILDGQSAAQSVENIFAQGDTPQHQVHLKLVQSILKHQHQERQIQVFRIPEDILSYIGWSNDGIQKLRNSRRKWEKLFDAGKNITSYVNYLDLCATGKIRLRDLENFQNYIIIFAEDLKVKEDHHPRKPWKREILGRVLYSSQFYMFALSLLSCLNDIIVATKDKTIKSQIADSMEVIILQLEKIRNPQPEAAAPIVGSEPREPDTPLQPAPFEDHVATAQQKLRLAITEGFTQFTCHIDFRDSQGNLPIILNFYNPQKPGDVRTERITHNVQSFLDIIRLKQTIQSAILNDSRVEPYYEIRGQMNRTGLIRFSTFEAKVVPHPMGFAGEFKFIHGSDEVKILLRLGLNAPRDDNEAFKAQKLKAQERLDALSGFLQGLEVVSADDLRMVLKHDYANDWYTPEKGQKLDGYEHPQNLANGITLSAFTLIRRDDINPTFVLQFSIKPSGKGGRIITKFVNLHTDDIIVAEQRAQDVAEKTAAIVTTAQDTKNIESLARCLNSNLPRYEHKLTIREEFNTASADPGMLHLRLYRKPRPGQNSLTPFFKTANDGSVQPIELSVKIGTDPEKRRVFIERLETYLCSAVSDHYNKASGNTQIRGHRFDPRTVENCLQSAYRMLSNEYNVG